MLLILTVAKSKEERCGVADTAKTCPNTCGTCEICEDSPYPFNMVDENSLDRVATCAGYIQDDSGVRCTLKGVKRACRKTCNFCN